MLYAIKSSKCVDSADVCPNSDIASTKGSANNNDVSVNNECVNAIDISDTVHLPNQQSVDCPFISDQEVCNSLGSLPCASTIKTCNIETSSLDQGIEALRLWEIEQCDRHQITHVKGGHKSVTCYSLFS